MQFGKSLRKFFPLTDSHIAINSGGFGMTPNQVLKKKQLFLDKMNQNPDKFFKWENYYPMQQNSLALLANFLKVNNKNLTFLTNVTEGINTIFHSINLGPDDAVLTTDPQYRMIKNVLSKFQKEKKFNIVEHVGAHPSLVYPLKEMIDILRDYNQNIKIIVDGAHAPGHINFNIEDLNPTYYIGTMYKWGFAPRPCAFLWLSEELQQSLNPLYLYKPQEDKFHERFAWKGMHDITNELCIEESLNFIDMLGEQAIKGYIKDLSLKVGQRVADLWQTQVLSSQETSCAQVNIEIPNLKIHEEYKLKQIKEQVFSECNTHFLTFVFDGKLWVRFSAYVYNDLSEYEIVAKKFLQIQETLQKH